MLRSAIYTNVFLLLLMSIIFIILSGDEKTNFKNLKKTISIYIIINIISIVITMSGIVEIDFDAIYLFPASLLSLILFIIGITRSNKKLNTNDISSNFKLKNYIIVIIPILVFMIPFIFELYVLNNCNYLLKYNYQDGMIISDDTYIAILNDKPVNVTLLKNIFNRKGINTDILRYDIKYTNGIEISTRDDYYNQNIKENENIKNIALDARERSPQAKSAVIEQLQDGNYSIVKTLSEESYGTLLGEYFYHNNTFIKNIETRGSIESITYYAK